MTLRALSPLDRLLVDAQNALSTLAGKPLARRANPAADIRVADTIEDAVRLAAELATYRKRKIYVAGGLFLAIEYETTARGGRAQDLRFF
jgi:hypothetical protein